MHKTIFIALTTLTSFFVVDSTAQACSCMEPSIERSFEDATDVAAVRIQGKRNIDGELIYAATVVRTVKGCTESRERVFLATAESSAACGVTDLRPGRTYLVFGYEAEEWRGRAVLDIGLCDYNRPISELTRGDRRFLRANYEECGETTPTCDAYAVDEFGMCDMMLGYGIQEETATCGAISGCGRPDDIELFNSMGECLSACIED